MKIKRQEIEVRIVDDTTFKSYLKRSSDEDSN